VIATLEYSLFVKKKSLEFIYATSII